MAQAPVVVVDDFDAAFEEAAKAGEKTLTEAPDNEESPPKEPAKEPAKDDGAALPKDPAKEPAKEEVVAPVKTTAEVVAEALAAVETRAAAKAAKDAETAAAAKVAKDAADAAAALEAPYVMTADETAALEKMQKEFPNEFVAMQARLKQESQVMNAALARSIKDGMTRIAELEQKLKPVAETVQSTQEDAHFAAIKGVHADYDDVVKLLPAWIAKLPAHRAIGAQAVYDKGDAASVIALFDDYKKETNIVTPAAPAPVEKPAAGAKPAPKKPTVEEIESGAPVASRRSAPSVKGEPDKNDYDGAWAEATKDE